MTSCSKLYRNHVPGYIYKIVFPNRKHYIGLTRDPEERWKTHKNNAENKKKDYAVYRAMRKYKFENLKFEVIHTENFEVIHTENFEVIHTVNFEVIHTVVSTIEEVDKLLGKLLGELEKKYISEYDSFGKNGYNMTKGGDGVFGYKHTPEMKKKQGEKTREQFKNPAAKQNHREGLIKYNRDNPEEVKKRGENISAHYDNNPEARQLASEKSKKQLSNPDARQKLSETRKAYFNTPGARQKQSETLKASFKNNPELRKMGKPPRPFTVTKYEQLGRRVLHKNGELIGTFDYQFKAQEHIKEKYNIEFVGGISSVLNGKSSHAKGFVFKYV